MRRLALSAVGLVVVLAGCAQAEPPARPQPSTSSASSATTSASSLAPSRTPSASATPSGSASAVVTPTVPPKALATATLPATIGAYRANGATGAVGEQSVTYAGPASTSDVIIVEITATGNAAVTVSALTSPSVSGPAVCGTVDAGGAKGATCLLPLDRGVIVINGSGAQTVAQVAEIATTLWATIA